MRVMIREKAKAVRKREKRENERRRVWGQGGRAQTPSSFEPSKARAMCWSAWSKRDERQDAILAPASRALSLPTGTLSIHQLPPAPLDARIPLFILHQRVALLPPVPMSPTSTMPIFS